MKLLYGHDKDVEAFVVSQVPHCPEGFGPCRAIGVLDRSGLLVGGMVYSNWDKYSNTIEMSGAAINSRWLTKSTLRGLFAYPFEVAGCQMVFMRNGEDQKALHRMLKAYGFNEYRVPRMFGREKNGHLWTLTDDDWKNNRFMKGQTNGKT